MRMGQGVRTGLGHGTSPVSYRHNFLVLSNFTDNVFVNVITFTVHGRNVCQSMWATRWPCLTLKAPVTTATDDFHKYFFIVLQRK